MGVKVDLLDEIYNRLEAAMATGGELESVKYLMIGKEEEARKANDFPVINIGLGSGDEEGDTANRMFTDLMSIELVLICNKLEGTKALYNKSTGEGALILFETILNVLDKKTDGTINNTFNGQAGYLRNNSYSVSYVGSLVIITLVIGVRSKAFALGAR